jgi:hypothetical protein
MSRPTAIGLLLLAVFSVTIVVIAVAISCVVVVNMSINAQNLGAIDFRLQEPTAIVMIPGTCLD